MEKILDQQSSHHFLIFVFLVFAHSPPFQGVTSSSKILSFTFFDLLLVQDFLFHSLSQIPRALVHLALAQTSPFFSHFFNVFVHSIFGFSFISLMDHPSTFFFSLGIFTLLPCDMRSFTTNSGTFCMASNVKELPSILLLSLNCQNGDKNSHVKEIGIDKSGTQSLNCDYIES